MKKNNIRVELSLVVCVYNEQDTIGIFLDKVRPILKSCVDSYEIIFVNDGSVDATAELLADTVQSAQDSVVVINLSRNFGKDYALTAGLDYATGRAIIPIDVDLQDPPELIPAMVEKWKAGAKTVMAIREDRSQDGFLKRLTATSFYKLVGAMSKVNLEPNAGDFRLIDASVNAVIKTMKERSRFMKGIFSYPGFQTDYVYYKRGLRSAGETKWSYWRLWNFALDGIVSFSDFPLKLSGYIGFFLSLFAFLYLIWIMLKTTVFGVDVPGYASIVSIVLFFNGFVLLFIGVLGEYLARVFNEVKSRPLYVVDTVIRKNASDREAEGASD